MGYGGFEMGFFWYAGYEFQKVGGKSGMRDWATPPGTPPIDFEGYICNLCNMGSKTILALQRHQQRFHKQ